MIKKPEGQQHHGNLKEALILAGLQILEEDGLEGLSLRKCAARAGVSHAAPAHHFDGLAGLKSAIATRAYRIFEAHMLAGIDASGSENIDRARGMCNGYIQFAKDHQALFNLIFVRLETLPQDPEREHAAESARQVLVDICAAFSSDPARNNVTEIAVWSLVHGYDKLIEIGRVDPQSGTVRDVLFEEIFAFLDLSDQNVRVRSQENC